MFDYKSAASLLGEGLATLPRNALETPREGHRQLVEIPGSHRRIGIYRIEATLGAGGMGEVFLAWDERLHRHVAIKRIRAELQADERHRARFRREARAVARLSHPAIVQIFDLLENDGGDCLVMERVEGRTLAEAVAGGEVDPELALRLAAEIADGLAEAHGKGLVHRDLKPENVIVTASGHAKILDFGLARMLWSEESIVSSIEDPSAALTRVGTLVGTVHAMSPEQATASRRTTAPISSPSVACSTKCSPAVLPFAARIGSTRCGG